MFGFKKQIKKTPEEVLEESLNNIMGGDIWNLFRGNHDALTKAIIEGNTENMEHELKKVGKYSPDIMKKVIMLREEYKRTNK